MGRFSRRWLFRIWYDCYFLFGWQYIFARFLFSRFYTRWRCAVPSLPSRQDPAGFWAGGGFRLPLPKKSPDTQKKQKNEIKHLFALYRIIYHYIAKSETIFDEFKSLGLNTESTHPSARKIWTTLVNQVFLGSLQGRLLDHQIHMRGGH